MVERQSRSDMRRSLKPRASGAMTDAVALATAHRRKSRHDTALRAPGRHRRRWHVEISRNMNEGRRTTASGKGQARLDGVAVTVGSLPWTRWTSCRRARGTIICAAAPEQNYAAVDISEKKRISVGIIFASALNRPRHGGALRVFGCHWQQILETARGYRTTPPTPPLVDV